MKLGVTLELVITLQTTGSHQSVKPGCGYFGKCVLNKTLVYKREIDRGYKTDSDDGLNKYNSVAIIRLMTVLSCISQ